MTIAPAYARTTSPLFSSITVDRFREACQIAFCLPTNYASLSKSYPAFYAVYSAAQAAREFGELTSRYGFGVLQGFSILAIVADSSRSDSLKSFLKSVTPDEFSSPLNLSMAASEEELVEAGDRYPTLTDCVLTPLSRWSASIGFESDVAQMRGIASAFIMLASIAERRGL